MQLPCLSNEADSSSRIMRVEEAFSDREKLMKNLLDKSFVEKHRRGTLKQIQVKRINQVSRHRYVENPMPKTPEHYWEVR
uniref:SAE2 domain-containing protein n=1 Tax=Heterorhabditis bacteriophora TaxID=37862 RepID=A0A1I7XM09_HETBA